MAYTEEGHTIIYLNDSVENYVVYFVKFDNGAGKYGFKEIEEKIIRIEIDSSLTFLNSFISVTGGAFCKTDDNNKYEIFCFDEQLKRNSIEGIDVSVDYEQLDDKNDVEKVKRIIDLLIVAYKIALPIYDNKVSGWNKIVYALESTQSMQSYDIVISNTIYNERVKKRVPRVWAMNEELTSLNHYLREKMSIENERYNTNNLKK